MPMSCKPHGYRLLALFAGLMMLGVALGPAPAAAEPAGPEPLKPRTSFTVGGLEMVLVLAKDRLYAFVDGVDDNVPAAVDRLSVESGQRHWDLAAVGPGLYRAAPFVLAPGHQPLTVDVAAGGSAMKVETVLDIGAAAAAPAGPGGLLGWLWWLVTAVAGVALVLALGGWRFGPAILRSPGNAN